MKETRTKLSAEFYEMAILVYRSLGEFERLARCMLDLGEVLCQRNSYASAEQNYRKAHLAFVRYQDFERVTWTIYGLSTVRYRLGDNARAKMGFRIALRRFSESNDGVGVANCHYGLGDIARRGDRNREALRRYERAREYFQRLGIVSGMAKSILSIGHIWYQQGEHTASLDAYHQAYSLALESKDLFVQINASQGIGDIYYQRGEYILATLHLSKAKVLAVHIEDPRGIANSIKSLCDVSMHDDSHVHVSDVKRQLEFARDMFIGIGDKRGAANCYLSLARISNSAIASTLIEHAMQLYKEIDSVLGVANCSLRLFEVGSLETEFDRARRLQNALALYQGLSYPLGIGNCLMHLGDVASQGSNYSDAEKSFLGAASSYLAAKSPGAVLAFQRLACLYERNDRLPAALDSAQLALEAVERNYSALISPLERHALAARSDELLNDALRIAYSAGDHDAAFDIAVRLQGRLLYEESGDLRSVDVRDHLLVAEVEEWLQIDHELSRWNGARDKRERELAAEGKGAHARLRDKAITEANVAISDLMARQSRLRERALHRRGRVEAPAPITGAAVIDAVSHRGITYALTSWSGDIAVLNVVTNGVLSVHHLEYDRDSVIGALRILWTLGLGQEDEKYPVVVPPLGSQKYRELWQSALDTLKVQLWEPTAALLPRDVPILFTPAGWVHSDDQRYPLGLLPFYTWAAEAGFDLSLVPAPGLLIDERVSTRDGEPLFALAGDAVGTLMGLGIEQRMIQQVFPGIGDRLVTPDKQPANALLTTGGHFKVVFISGHNAPGFRPEHAGLVLAVVDDNNEAVTRVVPVSELFSIRFTADVVVLSACAGTFGHGSSLLSTAGALLAKTNAKHVLATTWSVGDLGASLLALELLPRLKDGMDVRAALRESLKVLNANLRWREEVSGKAYVANLVERFDLSERQHAWLAGALAGAGWALPVGDANCWTIFSR